MHARRMSAGLPGATGERLSKSNGECSAEGVTLTKNGVTPLLQGSFRLLNIPVAVRKAPVFYSVNGHTPSTSRPLRRHVAGCQSRGVAVQVRMPAAQRSTSGREPQLGRKALTCAGETCMMSTRSTSPRVRLKRECWACQGVSQRRREVGM